MSIERPVIDPRDEEEIVAEVIDNLPAAITDRNRSNPLIKLIEGLGAFYGKLTYLANRWPELAEWRVLDLLGLEPEPATSAKVSVTFTSDPDSTTPITIPAGTVVKTGAGIDAIFFATDEAVSVPAGGASADVIATAEEQGGVTNVSAGTVIYFDIPVAQIASVTNATAASGGQDEETLAQLKARAGRTIRKGDRVVSYEDVIDEVESVPGVARAESRGAKAYVDGVGFEVVPGTRTVAVLLDTTLNEGGVPELTKDAILAALEAKQFPGIVTIILPAPVRLVMIETVEVELLEGYALGAVRDAVEAALARYITAYDIIAKDGRTIVQRGWRFGEKLYRNELISLIDRVEGVRRVGELTYRTSDDGGATWSLSALPLSDVEPGRLADWPQDVIDAFGVFHWGGEHTPTLPLTLSEIT